MIDHKDDFYLDPFERIAMEELGLIQAASENGVLVYGPTELLNNFCQAYSHGYGDTIERLRRYEMGLA